MTDAIDAVSQAERDWQNKRAGYYFYGDFIAAKEHAPIHKESGLYFRVSFDKSHVDTYNKRIDELLLIHGVPPWAPAKRIPDKKLAVQLLTSGGSPSVNLDASSSYEEKILKILKYTWTTKPPCAFKRIADSQILIVGDRGDLMVNRLDVFDLLEECLSVSYYYG